MRATLFELARLRGFRDETIRLLEQAVADAPSLDMDESREIDEAWVRDCQAISPAFRAAVERERAEAVAALRDEGADTMDIDLVNDIATAHVAMFDRLMVATLRMIADTLEREVDADLRALEVNQAIRRMMEGDRPEA